jgi:hypothetical protein
MGIFCLAASTGAGLPRFCAIALARASRSASFDLSNRRLIHLKTNQNPNPNKPNLMYDPFSERAGLVMDGIVAGMDGEATGTGIGVTGVIEVTGVGCDNGVTGESDGGVSFRVIWIPCTGYSMVRISVADGHSSVL